MRWLGQAHLSGRDRFGGFFTGKAHVIKSPHKSAACPRNELKLLEPLRDLFKDEVRKIVWSSGCPRRCGAASVSGAGLVCGFSAR